MVRRSMCQCDVLYLHFTWLHVTCLAASRIVCCVFSTRSSNLFKQVCILHVKRGQVSTLKPAKQCQPLTLNPHTGTLVHTEENLLWTSLWSSRKFRSSA